MDEIDRASEIAESEDLDVLSSALYQALEADLSGFRWPGNSKVVLGSAFEEINYLQRIVEDHSG